MKKNKKVQKKDNSSFLYLFFLVIILIIPNLYYSPAMDQQLEIRLFGLSIFLGILLLMILLTKNKQLLKRSELDILKNPAVIIYTFLILIIGISIFWSTNKSEAMYEFLKRITFFILFIYLIIFVLPKENSRIILIKFFVLFSLIIAIVGVFQLLKTLTVSKYSIDSLYLITGNFAQKNIFSEVLLISFAFSVYGLFILDKIWKQAAIAAALLTLLLIVYLMTRAIWAGFIISLGLSLLLYFFYLSKNVAANKLKSVFRYFIIILGLGILTIVIISLTDKNKTLQHQITTAFDFKKGNTFHRLNLWKKTLSLAEKHPVIGVGAGNWRIEILQYDLQVTTDKGRIMPDRTHNDYLQLLAENGIIGLTAFLLIFAFSIYFCLRMLKKMNDFQDSFFILILFFALIAYMIDAAFAFPRERIEMQIFLNIIFAFIVFEYHKTFKKENDGKSPAKITAFVFIFLVLLSFSSYAAYRRMQSEAGVKLIYKYNSQNNHEKVIKTSNEIYSSFSTITPFCDPILQIRAISMYQNKYPLNEVFETFENSLKDSPYHLETLNSMAIIYKNEKNYQKAMEIVNKALSYGPNDFRTKQVKSEILLTENKIDEAYLILRSIDPTTNNAQYKNDVNYILSIKIGEIASQTKNEDFMIQLVNASKNGDFLFGIYTKSLQKNEAFEKTFLETMLPLCNKEKIINDETINKLKLKYQIK